MTRDTVAGAAAAYAQTTAERAVNNVWLTAVARLSMIVLTAVMIPTGAWVLLSLISSQHRIGLNEQRLAQVETRALDNAAEIRALAQRMAQNDAAMRGTEVQLRNMESILSRIETRVDAALSQNSGGQRP